MEFFIALAVCLALQFCLLFNSLLVGAVGGGTSDAFIFGRKLTRIGWLNLLVGSMAIALAFVIDVPASYDAILS